MPPSGYRPSQSGAIRAFCRSCVSDLISENLGLREPCDALRRELRHIDHDLTVSARPHVAVKVLELTRAFYVQLLSCNPSCFDELENSVESVLDSIVESILDIHVADIEG